VCSAIEIYPACLVIRLKEDVDDVGALKNLDGNGRSCKAAPGRTEDSECSWGPGFHCSVKLIPFGPYSDCLPLFLRPGVIDGSSRVMLKAGFS